MIGEKCDNKTCGYYSAEGCRNTRRVSSSDQSDSSVSPYGSGGILGITRPIYPHETAINNEKKI